MLGFADGVETYENPKKILTEELVHSEILSSYFSFSL